MKKIHKALLVLNHPKAAINKIKEELDADEVVTASVYEPEDMWHHLEEADVVMTSYPLLGLDKKDTSNLRWLHADMAGPDMMYTPELASRDDLVVTAGNGRSSNAVAEHAFMFMLNLAFCFTDTYEAQKQKKWLRKLPDRAMTLTGKTAAIFGVGSVGSNIAKRCKVFGMEVLGYNRTPLEPKPPFDQYYADDDGKQEILKKADFVILALPLTDETYHMLGKKDFDMMKDSAYVINPARGPILNENELIEALKNKQIAGFAADSFEIEPLDPKSPLWTMENVLITPHASPSEPGKQAFITNLILDNIKAYKQGKKMRNVVEAFYAYSGPQRLRYDRRSSD